MNSIDIDSALAKVGGFRRWNFAMYWLMVISTHMPLAWHALSIVFVGWEPPHTCIGSNSNITHFDRLTPDLMWSNNTNDIVRNRSDIDDKKCHLEMEDPATGNIVTEKCNKWNYENDGYHTIVQKWDLVCDRNFMAELSQTLFQLGSLIGESFSFLIDRYGRKRMHIITHFLAGSAGVINAYSINYSMFAVSKALTGLFASISLTAGIMLLLEFFDSKHRTFPGIMLQMFWSLCYLMLPLLAYFIKGWVNLQLTISLIPPIYCLLVFLLPESPSWLVSKGEIQKADEILQKIAKWNNVKLDQNLSLLSNIEKAPSSNQIDEKSGPDTSYKAPENYVDPKNQVVLIVDTPTKDKVKDALPVVQDQSSKFKQLLDPVILKFVTISSLLWFSTCLVFYGLILATPGLNGNRFLNFATMGFVEWPATILAFIFSTKVGRRLTASLTLLIAGCLVAIVVFIPSDTESLIWAKLALVMISKGFISATFAVMILYTKELFPTNLRATCCGICQVWGRIGSLLAPMAAFLIKTNLYWVPNIIFGIISLIVSVLLLLLPETNNQPLPESLEDCRKLNSHGLFNKRKELES